MGLFAEFGRTGPKDHTGSNIPSSVLIHPPIIVRRVSAIPGRFRQLVHKATRARSTFDFEMSFSSSPTILRRSLGRSADDVRRRLAILSAHEAGEMFQRLQHVRLEVPVLTELHECFEAARPACEPPRRLAQAS